MIAYAHGIVGEGEGCYFAHFFNFPLGGWIMGLIFAIIVGLVIYYAIKGIKGKDARDEELTKEAINAIKVRYAKGEITEEEYKKIKRELEEES